MKFLAVLLNVLYAQNSMRQLRQRTDLALERTTITIGLEMCLCGDEKWNRARSFAANLSETLGGTEDVWIEQFAEDMVHVTQSPNSGFTFYEDPYAWAGLGSDIRFFLQRDRLRDGDRDFCC